MPNAAPADAERRRADPGLPASARMMWLNADRVAYLGLLGAPSVRCLGAYSLYVSGPGGHRVQLEAGLWQQTELSVVAPYVRHRIASEQRAIHAVLIEPDTIDPLALPHYLRTGFGALDAPRVLAGLRLALLTLGMRGQACADTAGFDTRFFGAPLRPRALDARLERVLERIRRDPHGRISGEECAGLAGLSYSRLLHLFKAQTGVSFRSFRAWRRARGVLHHVRRDGSLTDIALDTGYPDATHFSHSMRQVFGLTPSAIFRGSRRLALYEGQTER